MQLRRDMGGLYVDLTGEGLRFTIRADHPGALFLRQEDNPVVHVTIDDDEGTRRWGVVSSWEIRKTGLCEKCEHCQAPVMTVTLYEGPSLAHRFPSAWQALKEIGS
ncbi:MULTISPECIES: hypothetical protein [Nocardia]|uniref:hypothetical protein n=1 Tax=Nocardia TaxID=1817 RepID=UPI002458E188|nr:MULTISPECIES: hypothetical protein [Nocardia]